MKDYDIFWQMFRNGSQDFAAAAIRQEIERQVEVMLPQIVKPLVEQKVRDYLSDMAFKMDFENRIMNEIYKSF